MTTARTGAFPWTAVLPVAALVATMHGCNTDVPKDGDLYAMEIAGQPFKLKVSCSDATRTRGLGGVTTIAEDGGMIFIFPDSQVRRFWMKDCVVDMDIVFLDPLGIITAIHTMTVEPPRGESEPLPSYEQRLKGYSSIQPAQFAIELRKGRAAELGLKQFQKLPFDTKSLRTIAK